MPNAFTTGLRGLLDTGMMGDIGTGLLSQSGWSPTPVTFGQAMGNTMQFVNSRQRERLELEAARQKIQQQKDREAALKELPGLLSPQTAPWAGGLGPQTPINTPEGQSRALGLLTQIAPEQVASTIASGLLSPQQSYRPPAGVQEFQYVQSLPPEQRQAYMEFLQQKDPGAGTEALTAQANLQRLTLEIENARAERDRQNETLAQEKATTRTGIVRDLNHLEEMAELNDRLEGTVLESGRPMVDVLRAFTGGVQGIQDLLGVDSTKAQQLKADFDTMTKYSTDFVVGSVDRLGSSGALTNNKIDMLISSNANMGASPITNRQIIANNIEALLDGAEIGQYDIGDVTKYRELANRLKSANSPANPLAGDLLNVDFNSLTDDQLANLVQRLEGAMNAR